MDIYLDEVNQTKLPRKLARVYRLSKSLVKTRILNDSGALARLTRAAQRHANEAALYGVEGTVSELADLWESVKSEREDRTSESTLIALVSVLDNLAGDQ